MTFFETTASASSSRLKPWARIRKACIIVKTTEGPS